MELPGHTTQSFLVIGDAGMNDIIYGMMGGSVCACERPFWFREERTDLLVGPSFEKR